MLFDRNKTKLIDIKNTYTDSGVPINEFKIILGSKINKDEANNA
tara:strand:- start:80 stop:211 length:132 start_codon:yes stop_codon:yes gene_type:complete